MTTIKQHTYQTAASFWGTATDANDAGVISDDDFNGMWALMYNLMNAMAEPGADIVIRDLIESAMAKLEQEFKAKRESCTLWNSQKSYGFLLLKTARRLHRDRRRPRSLAG